MIIRRRELALHFGLIVGIAAIVVFCIFYPFLPGRYDALAVPLSGAAQAFAIAGLLFAPLGALWLAHELWRQERRRHYFAAATVIMSTIIVLAFSILIAAGISLASAVITLFAWGCVLWLLVPKLRLHNNAAKTAFTPVPLYLILVPIATVACQLLFANSATEFSRNFAIEHCEELIGDIEQYRANNGEYPESLFAEWQDYDLPIVGIREYHYARDGETYNLAFRQPTFLHRNPGTIEFVIYNPRDKHLMLGHDSDILRWEPDVLHERQGWYAAHDTAYPHWKYFWFD
jgi:hypothetical protein